MNELLLDIGAITAVVVASTAITGFVVTLQRRRHRLRRQERLEVAFSRAQATRMRGGAPLFGSSEA